MAGLMEAGAMVDLVTREKKDDRYDGQEERKTLTWTGNGEQKAMVSWAWVEILLQLK